MGTSFEMLATPAFTLVDGPVAVLLWVVSGCVVCIVVAYTALLVARLIVRVRALVSEPIAPAPPPPPKIVPKPKTGPKRQAASKLYLGPPGSSHCPECHRLIERPDMTRIQDGVSLLCYTCPDCQHQSTVAIT